MTRVWLATLKSLAMNQMRLLPRMAVRIGCLFCVAWLCCIPLPGCGRTGSSYQEVTGKVTFQGELIKEGAIQFFTDGAQPAVCGGAMIRDGNYQLPAEHGLNPGCYLVRISSAERIDNPDKAQAEMSPFWTRERIPAKFNTESKLKIEFQAGQPAQFIFNLQ